MWNCGHHQRASHCWCSGSSIIASCPRQDASSIGSMSKLGIDIMCMWFVYAASQPASQPADRTSQAEQSGSLFLGNLQRCYAARMLKTYEEIRPERTRFAAAWASLAHHCAGAACGNGGSEGPTLWDIQAQLNCTFQRGSPPSSLTELSESRCFLNQPGWTRLRAPSQHVNLSLMEVSFQPHPTPPQRQQP